MFCIVRSEVLRMLFLSAKYLSMWILHIQSLEKVLWPALKNRLGHSLCPGLVVVQFGSPAICFYVFLFPLGPMDWACPDTVSFLYYTVYSGTGAFLAPARRMYVGTHLRGHIRFRPCGYFSFPVRARRPFGPLWADGFVKAAGKWRVFGGFLFFFLLRNGVAARGEWNWHLPETSGQVT